MKEEIYIGKLLQELTASNQRIKELESERDCIWERCAEAARIECQKTRHYDLGHVVYLAIRAEREKWRK